MALTAGTQIVSLAPFAHIGVEPGSIGEVVELEPGQLRELEEQGAFTVRFHEDVNAGSYRFFFYDEEGATWNEWTDTEAPQADPADSEAAGA